MTSSPAYNHFVPKHLSLSVLSNRAVRLSGCGDNHHGGLERSHEGLFRLVLCDEMKIFVRRMNLVADFSLTGKNTHSLA
jgi:hypothetical protein